MKERKKEIAHAQHKSFSENYESLIQEASIDGVDFAGFSGGLHDLKHQIMHSAYSLHATA